MLLLFFIYKKISVHKYDKEEAKVHTQEGDEIII